jgi:hypothetical protein
VGSDLEEADIEEVDYQLTQPPRAPRRAARTPGHHQGTTTRAPPPGHHQGAVVQKSTLTALQPAPGIGPILEFHLTTAIRDARCAKGVCHFLTYTVVYMRLAPAIRRGPLASGSLRMARGPWRSAQFPRRPGGRLTGANGQFLTNNDVKNDMGLTVIGFRPNG